MLPMAGRLGLIGVVPTLMRTLGISRGHILYNRGKGLDQLKKKDIGMARFRKLIRG